VIWAGLTTEADREWRLVAFDPKAVPGGSNQLRLAEGASGAIGGLTLHFDRVTSIPSAVGVDTPGSTKPLLAELSTGADGTPALVLVSSDQPAISLASGQATTSGNYEYTFVAQR